MTTETHQDQQTAPRAKTDHTRETASQAYHDAKDKAAAALHTSKDKAGELAHKTARTIESNPLGILVGGLVVGVIAGALIPRSAREKELLTPLGKKLGETGLRELEDAGLTKDAAKNRAKSLFDDVVKAASNAGSAAAKAATSKTSV